MYQKIIDQEALSSLKFFIDTDIHSIYSNGIEVHKNLIQSRLFILKDKNDNTWLNISNKCFESPNDNDYYYLIINNSEFPEEIEYNKEQNTVSHPFSKIIFDEGVIKIKSIDIYSRHEIYDNEELLYDVLLLFKCSNQFNFMICLEERVDEVMTYSSDESVIAEYINNDLELRMSI